MCRHELTIPVLLCCHLSTRRFRVPIKSDGRGYIDWLYLGRDIRVTKGSKGSLFVHTRAEARY